MWVMNPPKRTLKCVSPGFQLSPVGPLFSASGSFHVGHVRCSITLWCVAICVGLLFDPGPKSAGFRSRLVMRFMDTQRTSKSAEGGRR